MLNDTVQTKQLYWNQEHKKTAQQIEPTQYLQNGEKHVVNFSNDCILQVLEHINTPGLFSKIHYIHTPITIDNIIAADHTQTRINLQSQKKIAGRQFFPEIYEPFFGMTIADRTDTMQLLEGSEDWFASQVELTSFLVAEQEAKLISAEPLSVQADWHIEQHRGQCNQRPTDLR